MSASVTILGCGLMGTAFAEMYLKSSVEVTVWNRSADKCRPLVEKGAKQAKSFKEAISASPVILAILRDYAAFIELLAQHRDEVSGRDFIILMTGSPREASSLEIDIKSLGGRCLDGAILAYPENIGAETTQINYAGDCDVWISNESLLKVAAGGSRWVGPLAGSANVLDTALTGAFYLTSVGAFLEAAAYARISGVDVQELENSAEIFINQLRRDVATIVADLNSGEFTADQATITIYVSALKTWRQSMLDAGAPARLLSANLHAMEMAIASGYGELGVAATYVNDFS